jgi:hypothetical protein
MPATILTGPLSPAPGPFWRQSRHLPDPCYNRRRALSESPSNSFTDIPRV